MVSLDFYQNVLCAHSNILSETIPITTTYIFFFLVKSYEK